MLDAREVLVVGHGELGVDVDWARSAQRLAHWRQAHPQARVVATGFVARDGQDRITTLGRNGSDYSGAIFAALFEADELHIWTDVDGVLSADPRLVPEAVLLPSMSYDEAFELGATLAEAARTVKLNHRHCARFCVLGGASCSAGE